MDKANRSVILIGLLALIWGSSFLWIKFALNGFSPLQVTFGRLLLGAAVLLLITLFRRDQAPKGLKVWGHLVVAAFFANALPYLFFSIGETLVSSSVAGALNASTPLWTMILALSVRSESRIGVWQTAGFIVGFLGALVVFSPWQNFHVDVFGAALCLLAAVSYAVSYVYMGRYLAGTKLSSVSLSAYQLLIAAAMLALTLPFDPSRRATLDLQSILAIVVLGALGTGIAYIINYTLIRTDGAARASTVTYVVPIVAVVLGVFVANEPLTITLVTGITLVLIGVSMIRKRVQ